MASIGVDGADFKGHLFRVSDLLSGPNSQSNVLGSSYEEFLKKKRFIPVSTLVYIPSDPEVRVDWVCPGWFSIHEIAFRTGFSFPCSDLMRDVIKTLEVMPFQIMPIVWKLVAAIDSLCIKHHLEITLKDLMNCYLVRTVGKGRVSFRALKVEEALITGLDSGDDKGWACRFLFINKATLGEGFDFIPDQAAEKPKEWKAEIDDASMARLTAFRCLDANERAWPRALCRPLGPQYDSVKKVKTIVPLLEDVQMDCPESGGKSNDSVDVIVKKEIPLTTPVGSRTRGKGKLGSVIDEIQSSKKKMKLGVGTKSTPIEIPAAPKQVDPEMGSAKPATFPFSQHSEAVNLTRALKALSLSEVDCEFHAASLGKSKEICESIAELANPGVLQLDYDSCAKRSIFAAFQALHFSSAAARINQSLVLERDELKGMISETINERESEEARHGETLRKLVRATKELELAKKSSDEKILKVLGDHEEKLKENAVQYSLIARIGLMLEPTESRAAWDVKEEIEVFKSRFPESKLEDWGISVVEDDPAVSK